MRICSDSVAAARRRIDEDVAYSDAVQAEDAGICARVQAGLASRAYDRGRFSVKYEAGVHHFQELLRAAYRRGLEGTGSARTAPPALSRD